mgnify:CR=1 FL=1
MPLLRFYGAGSDYQAAFFSGPLAVRALLVLASDSAWEDHLILMIKRFLNKYLTFFV